MTSERLRWPYVAVTMAAVGMACLWFLEGYPTVIYDSWGYYYLSEILRTKGLLAWPTDVRTYGYPAFLALVSGFRGLPPEELRLLAFGAQLAACLGACAYVSRKLAALFRSESAGFWAYAIGALNPVLLLHSTELLSDLMSAVLIQLAVALSWRVPADAATSRVAIRRPFLAFLCAGAATSVRPANVVVVAALVLVWAVRAVRWRDLRWGSAAAAAAGLLLPLIPQLAINYRIYGKVNFLIVKSLYRMQAQWGMAALKYGTVVMPDRSPFLVYTSPLFRGDPTPRAFLLHHPWEYLATLALHGFAMLDYDLPFTIITNLNPWYRWPLSVLNYALGYLAIVGCLLAVVRWIRRRRFDETEFALASTIVVGAAYLLIYLPVEVENRFGLTLEALMTPLILVSLVWLVREGARRPSVRRLLILGAFAAAASGVVLSSWISRQQTNPRIASPANAFVLDPPRARPPASPSPLPSLRP
ncbi:MAG: hypothetical protein ABI968_03195 [Acidobacteriota bacterium]